MAVDNRCLFYWLFILEISQLNNDFENIYIKMLLINFFIEILFCRELTCNNNLKVNSGHMLIYIFIYLFIYLLISHSKTVFMFYHCHCSFNLM